ncbi:MAG: hypothetical protein Fur0010_22220 [Bdellovibrio sp.]
MALSERAISLIKEYPKSNEYFDHSVAKALFAGTMELLKIFKKSNREISPKGLHWREVENFLRDSNLINAWNESDVDKFDLPEEWKKIVFMAYLCFQSRGLEELNLFDKWPKKSNFKYEILRIRQIHDYIIHLNQQIVPLLRLVDINGDEVVFTSLPKLEDKESEAVSTFLAHEFLKSTGERFKVVAE